MATPSPREPLGIRRRACPTCPFRSGPTSARLAASLHPERRASIRDALLAGESFTCHEEAHGIVPPGPAGPRQCTGAAVVLARQRLMNMVMALAVRYAEPPFEDPGPTGIPWQTLTEWVEQTDG